MVETKTKICGWCKAEFTLRNPHQHNQKFCSKRCAVKFHYYKNQIYWENEGNISAIDSGLGRLERLGKNYKEA